MSIGNVQAARQLLKTDLGDSPLGKMGGHNVQVGASAQPQAAAPTSLLDSVKAFGSRHFGSGTTAAVYANQKLQHSVQSTSQKVGDLIATLCRPGIPASANELQQLSRSLLSGAQDAADIAQLTPEKVVQTRAGLHVAQLNMAELQALHSSLKQLGAGGNGAAIDILKKEVAAHVLEREAAMIEEAVRDLGASMNVNLGLATALHTYSNSAGAQANWLVLKDTAKEILVNAGFGALSDSDMERKCESLILQTMDNLIDSASTDRQSQTIAHNLTQFFLAALPGTSLHSLASNEFRFADQTYLVGVLSCLQGAMKTKADQLETQATNTFQSWAAGHAGTTVDSVVDDLRSLAMHCTATHIEISLQPAFAVLNRAQVDELRQAMERPGIASSQALEPWLSDVQSLAKANDLSLLDASFDDLSATLEHNLGLSAQVNSSYDAEAAQAAWVGLKEIAKEHLIAKGFGALSPQAMDAKSETLLLSVIDRILDKSSDSNAAANITAFFQSALDDQALFDLSKHEARLEEYAIGFGDGGTKLSLIAALSLRADVLEAGVETSIQNLPIRLTATSTGANIVAMLQALAATTEFQAFKALCDVTGISLDSSHLFQQIFQDLRAKAQAQDPTLDALLCTNVLTLLGKQVSVPNNLRELIQKPEFSTEARSYFAGLKAEHSPEYSTFYEMYQAYIAQPSAKTAQALVDACVESPSAPTNAGFNALSASPVYLNISHQDMQAIHAGVASYVNQQMFETLIDPLFREATQMVGSPAAMANSQRASLAAQL